MHSLFEGDGNAQYADLKFAPTIRAIKTILPVAPRFTNVIDKSYYIIESRKITSSAQPDPLIWDVWNRLVLELVQRYSDLLRVNLKPVSFFKDVFQDIPDRYAIRSRLLDLEYELGEEDQACVSARSIFCMLRYLPVLDEKSDVLGFYLDDDTGHIGVSMVQYLDADKKKTLDLVFKDDGEIFYSFIEGGQGFSRISGTSYLTDYLVNSYKFRKLINIFDY